MIRRPRATFAYLRERGGTSWLWPALLMIVLTIVSIVVAAPISARLGAEAQARALEQQGIDPSSEQFRQIQSLTNNPLITIVLPSATAIAAAFFGWAVRSGVLHFASLALGGQSKFGAMFRASVWATALPDTLRLIVTTVGTALSGTVRRGGLAALVPGGEDVFTLDPALGALQAFLSGIDVFWLWAMVLTAIGVTMTAQFSWRKGLAVTLGYWLLTVLFTVGAMWLSLSATRQFSGLGN
jgi:hypothetical protein